MKKRKGKLKIFMCLLSLMMIGTLLPTTLFAEETGMESGAVDLTVNKSKVAFAGHEWWVIGDGRSKVGVYPQDGSITLLAVNNDFGENTAFNDSSFTNEYAGSTLQQKLEKIASEFQASFPKEYAAINGRKLTSANDGIAGVDVDNQKLWAISIEEFNDVIKGTGVGFYNSRIWWLRSPYLNHGDLSYAVDYSGDYAYIMYVSFYRAVRPALSLNLSSVLFISDASETGGKSLAGAGTGLIEASQLITDSATVKFTMKDESQKLTVSATKEQSAQTGETLTFTYSEATTGKNQYVSCILIDSAGEVKYYGKLADISAFEDGSGTISIPLSDVELGTYTLKIFSEEINDTYYTDFCSQPITMTVKVNGEGQGTVSDFGGTIIHEHDWSDTWSFDDTYHWHECNAEDCNITDNSDKDGYEAHVYDQEVVTKEYLAKEATCEEPAEYYYSCICGKSGTETFTSGEPLGHDWGISEWTWKEDYSGATAIFTCANDANHVEKVEATVTPATEEATCTENGQKTYTAIVTFNEKEFTDTKKVDIDALGHNWGEPKWTWKEDYSGATATFTCKNDSNHIGEKTTTVTSEIGKEATQTEAGIVKYSASVVFEGKTYDITKEVAIPATGIVTPVDPENPAEPTDSAAVTETGSAQDTDDNVQTSDSTNFALWIFLLLATGSTLSGTFVYRKKKKFGR